MAVRRNPTNSEPRRSQPATTIEARENELIGLAMDLVEEKIRNKTASSQELTHFLKAGSPRERLERERLQSEIRINAAKEEMLASQKRVEETYAKALNAMRRYSGYAPEPEGDDDGYGY